MRTTVYATCNHPGCSENAFWVFDSRKEAAEHYPTRKKWMCLRHASSDRLLSIEHPNKVFSEVSTVGEGCNGKRYWGCMGILSGPGFLAYADDFPTGTKITVTATIQLP